MTNYEKIMAELQNMSIEEFAEERVIYDEYWGVFRGDFGAEDDIKTAIKLEIEWLKQEVENDIYPLTIIEDRYCGVYSGAKYLAFNKEFYELDKRICGNDCECRDYWYSCNIVVGKGNTIQEAKADLLNQIEV